MSELVIEFIVLGICYIIGLVLTASRNHDASFLAWFAGCFMAVYMAINLATVYNLFVIIGLFLIGIVGLLMGIDSLIGDKKS